MKDRLIELKYKFFQHIPHKHKYEFRMGLYGDRKHNELLQCKLCGELKSVTNQN